ncbi:hypothetical protein PDESU_00417 [Pontiella desulfatans]|uniref:Uncharacterized protein n=1 Tax=Pontiella desulfatans TaxID=2750659 RepID=A0A6C2TW29_PONDE|nr:hypothetical protein PDESU_00417 [Pontiella desulfatans]
MKRWVLIIIIPVLMALLIRAILAATDPSMHDEVKKYATMLVIGSFVLMAVVRMVLIRRAR